jgi:hypothetical protein
MRASDNVRRPANWVVLLFFPSLMLMLQGANPVWAQQPSLPAVNLGDTSFLDAIAYTPLEEFEVALTDLQFLDLVTIAHQRASCLV